MYGNLPISIDLRITGKCNLNCEYCFGAANTKEELDFFSWCNLLDKFYEYNVRCLIFTGGEPTTRKDLLELLKYANKKGFFIVLSSNGLNKRLINYCEWIDVLSLPLDGSNYEHCKLMRNMTQEEYMQVMENMRLFKKVYPNKKLKIGTVVTQRNISNIEKIYYVIQEIADIWKLYQVSEHLKNTLIYKTELEVSDAMFSNIEKHIQNKFANRIKICFYRNSDRNGKYLFCEPNADAMVILNNSELVIGNFLNNFDIIMKNWQGFVKENLLEDNILDTYYFA